MIRALAAWALALVLALCAAPHARAQGSGDAAPTTVLLDLGFGGTLPSGQWAPVRVIVSPMDDPLEAVACIVVTMPNGEGITTLVPFDTTPGKETVIATTFWVPPSIASITVELSTRDGDPVASTVYGTLAGAQAIKLEPPTRMPIILGVGSPTLRLAFGNENYERRFVGPSETMLSNRVAIAKVASATPQRAGAPPWLPTTPMAYQGIAATVIDGQLATRLEPEGVRALREALISGGRVLIVNADNSELRAILGEHLPQGLSVRPARQTSVPFALGGPSEIVSRSFDTTTLPPGWRAVPQTQSLAVEGPVGLGWVMVLGFDPDQLADAGLVASTEKAWHGTLAPMIEPKLERGRMSLMGRSRDDPSLSTPSIVNAINWVSRAPTVGFGAFIAIFAMMVGLAVALGPVDRFVLKRLRAMHRWWLAALAWIILATAGAWILPGRVRSGPTSVSSVRVIDAWQQADGPLRAWQTSIDGIFMNRSATIDLDDLEKGSWLSPMVHPLQYTGMGSLVMAPMGSTMKPRATTARLWTVRTFQQHGATTPPVSARLELDSDRYTLRLDGAMADSVEVAAVRTGGQWLHVLPGASPRREGQSRVFRATLRDLTIHAPRHFDLGAIADNPYEYMYSHSGRDREPPPALAFRLPGSESRGSALEALSDTNQWAVVCLKWTNDQPLIGADVGETFSTMWVCRLAVPVETIRGTP